MTDAGEMHADLMSASRLEPDFKKARKGARGFDAVLFAQRVETHRMAAALLQERHALSIARASPNFSFDTNRLFDGARGRRHSVAKRVVNSLDIVAGENFAELLMRLIAFGDDERSARILIDSVNDAGTQSPPDTAQVFDMMKKDID